jgi:hypothetical protein
MLFALHAALSILGAEKEHMCRRRFDALIGLHLAVRREKNFRPRW